MKISVIMIDGSFRANTYGAKYFCQQDFDSNEYEVIWVEFYRKTNEDIVKNQRIKLFTLNNGEEQVYHSSYCFNRGILEARGELLIIPDADQIVKPDFLSKAWQIHSKYDQLVVYGYRYDEISSGTLRSFEFSELEDKCVLKNPLNYGGCLTVRKKWLLKVNGYEQHPIFRTGYHANGLDMYTRFKNLGLAIQWKPNLKLYHPWHPYTLQYAHEQEVQKKLIEWRGNTLQWLAFDGIDSAKNFLPPFDAQSLLKDALIKMGRKASPSIVPTLNRHGRKIKNALARIKHSFFSAN